LLYIRATGHTIAGYLRQNRPHAALQKLAVCAGTPARLAWARGAQARKRKYALGVPKTGFTKLSPIAISQVALKNGLKRVAAISKISVNSKPCSHFAIFIVRPCGFLNGL
jgi:hypothetical protein